MALSWIVGEAGAGAQTPDRTADAILGEIDAILRLPEPDFSREKDKAYIEEFKKRRGKIRVRRAELIGELHRLAPEHPRLVTLLPVRWRSLSGRMAGPDNNEGARDLSGELNEVLSNSRSPELKTEAAYIKAWIASDPLDRIGSGEDNAAKAKAVDEFIDFAPKDRRCAELLYLLSLSFRDEPSRQKAIYTRIVEQFPEDEKAKLARGLLEKLAAVGKPFELAFVDAIHGTRVSMQDLRGKIVVVDFWATWCAPCVAEMPRMKDLYAKYHDQGVKFIGISLDVPEDEGGLDRLKAFVAEKQIAWPQYYEGKGWETKLAERWGINSIPTVFLVDQEGRLYSVEAGGRLEALILELRNRKTSTTGE